MRANYGASGKQTSSKQITSMQHDLIVGGARVVI